MDSIILGFALLTTFAVIDMWFTDAMRNNLDYDSTRNKTAVIACVLWALFHYVTH